LRSMERVGPYHHVHKLVPRAERRVADIGDVPFRSRFNLDMCIEDIESHFTGLVAAGVRPLSVGGDHSITYPILKALGAGEPLGCVHIDAHCDTAGEYDSSKFHHGGPFRSAVLDGITMNQMMIALFRVNPDAFSGNINLLREGAVLRIPDAAELQSETHAMATAEVARQEHDWRGRHPLQAGTETEPAQDGYYGPVAGGETLSGISERVLRTEDVPNAEQVLGHFEERMKGLSDEQAVEEANRCMSCGMCFECDNCVIYCPQDAVFRVKKDEATTGRYVDTDYAKCVGCHICSDVCPTGYIDMALGE